MFNVSVISISQMSAYVEAYYIVVVVIAKAMAEFKIHFFFFYFCDKVHSRE